MTKFVIIQHEPTKKYISFNEVGIFGVYEKEIATILPENSGIEFLDHQNGYHDDWIEGIGQINTKDLFLYERISNIRQVERSLIRRHPSKADTTATAKRSLNKQIPTQTFEKPIKAEFTANESLTIRLASID